MFPASWRQSPFLRGFLGAMVGMAMCYLGFQAYQDHVAVRAIVQIINTNAAKQASQTPTR